MISIVCKVPQHAKERIDYYCFSPCCKETRLICYKCLQQTKHEGHQVLRLSDISNETKKFSEKSQDIIDMLLNLKFNFVDSIDELVQNLKQKFQQQPNNLDQFTFDQLESYLEGLLHFDKNNNMVQNDAISYIKLAIKNIEDVIEGLENSLRSTIKAGLHYQAPPELQQKVIDLQNQGTQLNFQEYYFNIFQNNDIVKAQDIMNQTLVLDPNNPVTLVMKGTHYYLNTRLIQQSILSQTKNYEAFNIFEKVLKIQTNNKQALIGLGIYLFLYSIFNIRGRFKFAEALKCYEKTIQQDPNNTQALLGKAHCLIKLRKDRKFQEAKTIYERILSQTPNNIEALWGLADLLFLIHEEAIKQYEKVLRINNNHVESISGKGDCCRLLGRFDEAMKLLKQAQQINPKHVLTLTRIGDCLKKLEDNQFVQDNKRNFQMPSVIIVKLQVSILKMSGLSLK